MKKNKRKKSPIKSFPCIICPNVVFDHRFARSRHYKYFHTKIHCPQCKDHGSHTFVSVKVYKRHLKTVHNPNRPRPYICDRVGCGKSYYKAKNLQQHVANYHNDDVLLQCNYCLESFNGKAGLTLHKKTVHSPQKCKWKCTICGNMYQVIEN